MKKQFTLLLAMLLGLFGFAAKGDVTFSVDVVGQGGISIQTVDGTDTKALESGNQTVTMPGTSNSYFVLVPDVNTEIESISIATWAIDVMNLEDGMKKFGPIYNNDQLQITLKDESNVDPTPSAKTTVLNLLSDANVDVYCLSPWGKTQTLEKGENIVEISNKSYYIVARGVTEPSNLIVKANGEGNPLYVYGAALFDGQNSVSILINSANAAESFTIEVIDSEVVTPPSDDDYKFTIDLTGKAVLTYRDYSGTWEEIALTEGENNVTIPWTISNSYIYIVALDNYTLGSCFSQEGDSAPIIYALINTPPRKRAFRLYVTQLSESYTVVTNPPAPKTITLDLLSDSDISLFNKSTGTKVKNLIKSENTVEIPADVSSCEYYIVANGVITPSRLIVKDPDGYGLLVNASVRFDDNVEGVSVLVDLANAPSKYTIEVTDGAESGTLLFSRDFVDEASVEGFTLLNIAENRGGFKYMESDALPYAIRNSLGSRNVSMGYSKNTWLITPVLNLVEGQEYQITYLYSSDDNGRIWGGVFMGKTPTAAGLTTAIVDESLIFWGTGHPNSNNPDKPLDKFEKRFTANETGDFYIGLYDGSDTDGASIRIYGVTVVAVEDSEITPVYDKEFVVNLDGFSGKLMYRPIEGGYELFRTLESGCNTVTLTDEDQSRIGGLLYIIPDDGWDFTECIDGFGNKIDILRSNVFPSYVEVNTYNPRSEYNFKGISTDQDVTLTLEGPADFWTKILVNEVEMNPVDGKLTLRYNDVVKLCNTDFREWEVTSIGDPATGKFADISATSNSYILVITIREDCNVIVNARRRTGEDEPVQANFNVINEEFEIGCGDEATLTLSLGRADEINGFQTDITLPEGLSIAQNSRGKLNVTLGEGTALKSHSLTAQKVSGDNRYRVLVYSSKSETFTSGDGLLNIPLVSDDSFAGGEIVIDNTELNFAADYTEKPGEVRIPVNLMLYGDANDNGRVAIDDIVAEVLYIMENDPQPFSLKKADVNRDGSISIADVMKTVGIVLSNSNATPVMNMVASTVVSRDGSSPLSLGEVNFVDGKAVLTISLGDIDDITALQGELSLPEGVKVTDITLADAQVDRDHNVDYRELNATDVRFAVYSLSLDTLEPDAQLLDVELSCADTFAGGNLTLSDIMLTDTKAQAQEFGKIDIAVPDPGVATGIKTVGANNDYSGSNVYNTQGVLLMRNASNKDIRMLREGIYILHRADSITKIIVK